MPDKPARSAFAGVVGNGGRGIGHYRDFLVDEFPAAGSRLI